MGSSCKRSVCSQGNVLLNYFSRKTSSAAWLEAMFAISVIARRDLYRVGAYYCTCITGRTGQPMNTLNHAYLPKNRSAIDVLPLRSSQILSVLSHGVIISIARPLREIKGHITISAISSLISQLHAQFTDILSRLSAPYNGWLTHTRSSTILFQLDCD